MMGRTLRAQMVAYVQPAFKEEFVEVVESGQAQGKRVTLSSLCEEALLEGFRIVRERYMAKKASFNSPTQGTPGKKSRRRR